VQTEPVDRRLVGAGAAATLLLAGMGSATGAVTSTSQARSAAAPLPIGTGWGPTAAEIQQARDYVSGLTLRQKAGQVLVVSYTGTSAPNSLVNELHLGGVISFAANITDPAQIRGSNQALQDSAQAAGRPYPVLTAVDQEGGRVARLTTGATLFPSLMTAGAAGDRSLTTRMYQALAGEIASVGFNVDFAPDADVTRGPADPTIGSRSAGSWPKRVARQSVAARAGVALSGVIPVLKHFPGHGSVTTDSHLGLPVQRKSLAELKSSDLVPFQAGIDDGASAIMVGHLDVRAIDPGVPSSLSRKVVTGLLRRQLGFQGLAVTDSLQMGAVVQEYGAGGAAVSALKAGEDMLLMPSGARTARKAIVDAVDDGSLDVRRLDQAATRFIALLLHQQAQGVHPVTPGTSDDVAAEMAAAGITVADGRCSGRMVGSTVDVTGPAAAVDSFKAAAQAAGLGIGPGGRTVRLIGPGGSPATGGVIVAMDTPYVLGESTGRVARIATYSDTPAAMKALVAVLLGQATAPGRLPVRVKGVPSKGC
jgi:beta-N-acetylhexosaminidase